jgi:hypothetical protein
LPPVRQYNIGKPLLTRTNAAHDLLLRLETHLRRFLDELMTKKFGTDWCKSRLPNGICDRWREKKEAAMQAGGEDWLFDRLRGFH